MRRKVFCGLVAGVAVLSLIGCSAKRQTRHYAAIQKIAEKYAEVQKTRYEKQAEVIKALIQARYGNGQAATARRVQRVPVYYDHQNKQHIGYIDLPVAQPAGSDIGLVLMAFAWMNQQENEHTLQNALGTIPAPAPDAGERAVDGIFRVLPTALGIAAGAYALHEVRAAAEGAAAYAAARETNNYNYQSHNTQSATIGGGGAGTGGGGGDNNVQAIGQSMDFQGGTAAQGSPYMQSVPTTPVDFNPAVGGGM